MKYDITRKAEGCKLKAYICPAGHLTIGYGHTGEDVKPGMVITQEQADALFAQDIKKFEVGVVQLVSGKVTLSENEFEALVDFAFNKGLGALKTSTLLKLVLANKKKDAAEQFLKWKYADGTRNKKDDDGDGLVDEAGERQVLPGLLSRGEAQRKLFLGL